MLKFKDILAESELLSEATKKDVLAYMARFTWNTNDAYLFGVQAKRAGLFKTDAAASKAFNKYFDEYNKGPKGTEARATFVGTKASVPASALVLGGTTVAASKPTAAAPKAKPTATAKSPEKSNRNWSTELIDATKEVHQAYKVVDEYARGANNMNAWSTSEDDPVGNAMTELFNNGLESWMMNNVKINRSMKQTEPKAPKYANGTYAGVKELTAKIVKLRDVISDLQAAGMAGPKMATAIPNLIKRLDAAAKTLKTAKVKAK